MSKENRSTLLTAAALAVPSTIMTRGDTTRNILAVPVRKPGRGEFVQCHAEWRSPPIACIKERNPVEEVFAVDPKIVNHVKDEVTFHIMVPMISTAGAVFIWPIRVSERANDTWSRSAMDAADDARGQWRRIYAADRCYETVKPVSDSLTDPAWPASLSWDEMFDLAFREHYIDSVDHPVLRRLRGDF